MLKRLRLPLLMLLALVALQRTWGEEFGCYELRIYHAAPGKLKALHDRFRQYACKLFEKHGIKNVGYWVPEKNPDRKLYYLLAYPNREARDIAWNALVRDPECMLIQRRTEQGGRLISKVDNLYLRKTDFSPPLDLGPSNAAPRVYQLCTYVTREGGLDQLCRLFRDRAVSLLNDYDISPIGFWVPFSGQEGEGNTLVCLVAHPHGANSDGRIEQAFRDLEWLASWESSVKEAAPVAVNRDAERIALRPTDYSLLR
jgi:hypothetical protein